MKNKYIMKGLLLIFLFPSTIYYFLNRTESEVTFTSFFIVIHTLLYLYEEFTLIGDRTIYQKIIDRSLTIILTILSLDVLISFLSL